MTPTHISFSFFSFFSFPFFLSNMMYHQSPKVLNMHLKHAFYSLQTTGYQDYVDSFIDLLITLDTPTYL